MNERQEVLRRLIAVLPDRLENPRDLVQLRRVLDEYKATFPLHKRLRWEVSRRLFYARVFVDFWIVIRLQALWRVLTR